MSARLAQRRDFSRRPAPPQPCIAMMSGTDDAAGRVSLLPATTNCSL